MNEDLNYSKNENLIALLSSEVFIINILVIK